MKGFLCFFLFYIQTHASETDHDHRTAELGFWLLPEYWGPGFMSEALDEICRHAHGRLAILRIEAFVESENDGSKRVLEGIGFSPEGWLQDCEMKNGRSISLDIFVHFTRDSAD